jgi:ATP-dependent RNA helicase RhlE
VKIVSDHPYPWHSGSPKQHPEDLQNQKFKQSGGAHKSRKSDASKQNKNAGTNRFFKINNKKYLST